jgi:hypothetical protein
MMIVAATMCLHNYIREMDAQDKHFRKCDRNPDYLSTIPSRYAKYLPSRNASDTSTPHSSDRNMINSVMILQRQSICLGLHDQLWV